MNNLTVQQWEKLIFFISESWSLMMSETYRTEHTSLCFKKNFVDNRHPFNLFSVVE
jgi:hypothetical protein